MSNSTSSGENPARAAEIGSTLKVMAGPLIVLSIPFRTSTMPLVFLISSASLGAHSRSRSMFCENSLISIGSGELVKSPIISESNCGNSTSSIGNCLLIFARTSEITSSTPRFRSLFNFTVKSPRFASVTCANPS